MTDKEQIEAFADELDKLVSRYEKEFDLSAAGAIGVLQFKTHAICQVAFDDNQDDPPR
jgi:hypothetical protein